MSCKREVVVLGTGLLASSRRAEVGNVSGMRAREKPKGCLPARFWREKTRDGDECRPSVNGKLRRFLRGLRCGWWSFLCFLLRGALLLHLGGDGLGVDLVSTGGILEDGGRVAPRGCKQNARLDHQPGERAFIRATNKSRQRFADASIVPLLSDAMLPRQHLHAVLVHDA